MKNLLVILILVTATFIAQSCGKEEKTSTTNQVREKVKEVVSQPLTTYEAAKDSLNASSDKTKVALEEQDKELKR